MPISQYFRWAELPPRDDIHVWEGTTRWGNHDLYPIPKKEKNYGVLGFYSYYAISAISIYGFTSASAYVSAGLGVWDTVGAMLLGSCISSFNSYLGAQVGVEKGLGFTMMTRATFGLWGCLLPLANALIANLVFVRLLVWGVSE
jgi:NCS1 family nucleobase:cation symporter-1